MARSSRSKAKWFRPQVEQLEDRLAPAMWIVTGDQDNLGGKITPVDAKKQVFEATTLRAAIEDLNLVVDENNPNPKKLQPTFRTSTLPFWPLRLPWR
jgi:hypothetical protein